MTKLLDGVGDVADHLQGQAGIDADGVSPGRPGYADRVAVTSTRSTPQYRSRPGRLAVVVEDLTALHGPTGGVVELPHRLLWRPDRSVDLRQPWQLRLMYEAVLTEAVRVDELCTWLDAETLVRVWSELYLPQGVRRAWEERHLVLRGLRAAA